MYTDHKSDNVITHKSEGFEATENKNMAVQ